jgi:hypothetical protein
LEQLSLARQVAEYSKQVSLSTIDIPVRVSASHIGAVLADSILQAGLNYRTVVQPRVERIVASYPHTATLSGTAALVRRGETAEFLAWKHAQKIERFTRLVTVLEGVSVEYIDDLQIWLQEPGSRVLLLQVAGIGLKTVDYLCALAGVDALAVDRHIRTFAKRAGVEIQAYEDLKLVMSYAADLLGLQRREFDLRVWEFVSAKPPECTVGPVS